MNRERLLHLAGITEGIQSRTMPPRKAANLLIAELLEEFMGPVGILDDYDEILQDVYEQDGYEGAREYHERILAAVAFIAKNNPHSSLRPEMFADEINELQ